MGVICHGGGGGLTSAITPTNLNLNNFRMNSNTNKLITELTHNDHLSCLENNINDTDDNSTLADDDVNSEINNQFVSTATMPYLKNHTNKHIMTSPSNLAQDDDEDNPNLLTSSSAFPKSATTWGPLNKSMQWKVRGVSQT